jgi:hypothetical protein
MKTYKERGNQRRHLNGDPYQRHIVQKRDDKHGK